MRVCSKPGCTNGAVATLTYDYQDSTAVLGPLATSVQPHTYDFCDNHAQNLTVPRGWQVIRLQTKFDPAPPSSEDLLALVEVIRDVAGVRPGSEEEAGDSPRFQNVQGRAGRVAEVRRDTEDPAAKYAPLQRREHLTVIAGEGSDSAGPGLIQR